MINEIRILCNIIHPNIVRIHEFYQEEGKLIIVMENLKGGDIFDYITKSGSLTEKKTA
jgi:serine/threonine protein kinase